MHLLNTFATEYLLSTYCMLVLIAEAMGLNQREKGRVSQRGRWGRKKTMVLCEALPDKK